MCVFGSVVVVIGAFLLHTLGENKYDLYAAMEPQSGYGPKEPDVYSRYVAFLTERNAGPSVKQQLATKQSHPNPSPASQSAKADHAGLPSCELPVPAPSTVDRWKSADALGAMERADTAADASALHTTTAPSGLTLEEDAHRTGNAATVATTTLAETNMAATLSEAKDSGTFSSKKMSKVSH
ncbi:uncharacterized protein [Dermacentor andersoni]|uniref:uncharacterized protein n=1 Tax=Dermacentor andersoni TaxID=34620 RepID=UPI0021555123|nr:uncharacterized protein LOC126539928 [Dermacentor andersoni]